MLTAPHRPRAATRANAERTRVLSTGPAPFFDVDFDSSIVPLIGTAGTYARTGDLYYGSGLSSIAKVTANNPPVHSFPTLLGETTLTTKGGLYHLGSIQNYLKYSDLFTPGAPVGNPWTVYGTGGALDPSVLGIPGPYNTGSNNAGAVFASDVDSGVYQDLGITAASKSLVFAVWLRTLSGVSGPISMKLFIEDGAGTPSYAETTCAVVDSWRLFSVYKAFAAGATGNAYVSIQTNEAGGAIVHAFGAGAYGVATIATSTDLRADYDQLPYIPTTSAVANLTRGDLSYAGSEITTQRGEVTICGWFYVPNSTNVATQKRLWSWHDGAADYIVQSDLLDASGTVRTNWGNTASGFSNASVAVNEGAWNHYAVALKPGDNQQFVNGASGGTSAYSWTPRAQGTLFVGQDATPPTSIYSFDSQIGRIQAFPKRMILGEVSALYYSQKGAYGL